MRKCPGCGSTKVRVIGEDFMQCLKCGEQWCEDMEAEDESEVSETPEEL